MPDNIEIISSLINNAIQKGAVSADAISFHNTNTSVTTRFRKLENIERAESNGIGLRVFIGKRQAIVSSTDTKPEALNELVNRAINMAKLAPEDAYTGIAQENILCQKPKDLDLFDNLEPSSEELFSLAATAEGSALDVKGITNSEGGEASFNKSSILIATSNGFINEYKTSLFSISTSVLTGEGTSMEREYDFSSKRHKKDLESPESIGRNAAEKALRKTNPRRIKTCAVPVVFDPRISKSLLGAFSSAINGASVAKGSTFLKNHLGQAIFKNGINIINDPHIQKGLASKPYDAEGVKNSKISLIEDGTLTNWLLDIRSANQLGLITNGCASRSLASPPSPSCSNLYMENGRSTPDQLIASIKSGLYVTETFGMGINIITGDYSQGASGFWIENGKISYPVNEITIAGSLIDMFMQTTPANDLEFRYSTNSPTLLIDKMTVAGA